MSQPYTTSEKLISAVLMSYNLDWKHEWVGRQNKQTGETFEILEFTFFDSAESTYLDEFVEQSKTGVIQISLPNVLSSMKTINKLIKEKRR